MSEFGVFCSIFSHIRSEYGEIAGKYGSEKFRIQKNAEELQSLQKFLIWSFMIPKIERDKILKVISL